MCKILDSSNERKNCTHWHNACYVELNEKCDLKKSKKSYVIGEFFFILYTSYYVLFWYANNVCTKCVFFSLNYSLCIGYFQNRNHHYITSKQLQIEIMCEPISKANKRKNICIMAFSTQTYAGEWIALNKEKRRKCFG